MTYKLLVHVCITVIVFSTASLLLASALRAWIKCVREYYDKD